MAAVGADEAKGGEDVGFEAGSSLPPPTNQLVTPLLTDMYQISMTYAYWKAGRQDDVATFDLFFRKNPFKGEYTVFAGLEEVLRFIDNFRFSAEHIAFLRKTMPTAEDEFFEYLAGLDCSDLKVYAIAEGTVVFPRVPLIKLVGSLAICQLLETTILCLCNYASLMATNATRFRHAAGEDKVLLEFGLRRAQGPDGAMSASRYAFMGGFDGTSNVAAGFVFGMQPKGTHAHSFVSSYTGLDALSTKLLASKVTGEEVDFVDIVLQYRRQLSPESNKGELAAFIAFAQAFPTGFLALVDTYDTLRSGIPNFLAVALALNDLGYKAVGIRLDSGDLAYLSVEARKQFVAASAKFGVDLAKLTIVASNDINEAVLYSLKSQGHDIDAFGIGTNLVTCQAQPALGMVYKLVEVNGRPRIKLSQEITKVTIPGDKEAFRLLNADGEPLLDFLVRSGEAMPEAGRRLLSRHPFEEKKRVYVNPSKVVKLLELTWIGAKHVGTAGGEGKTSGVAQAGLQVRLPSLRELKARVKAQLTALRPDHVRHVNPSPYKVSVSPELYTFIHELWMREVPIPELK